MASRASLDSLIADLGKMPAELRKELRPAMRKAAEPILRDAKSRASWSSRIPGAIGLTASFTARRPGVRMKVNSARAPHARPYEFGSGRNRNLRHPVFPRTDLDPPEPRTSWTWTEQAVRPFFFPAVQAGAAGVVEASSEAVQAAARRAGFR